MKFEFESRPSLPYLAWCASVREGENIVRLYHGAGVETYGDYFFEGAWDGPFEAFRFDKALMLAGSGGRIVDGAILFAAPSHMLERLYSIQAGHTLYVSNSLAFLLVQADVRLDIGYPYYYFDFLRYFWAGIQITEKRIPTQSQAEVYLHDCGNIMVKPDLTMTRYEKCDSDPPPDYATYATFLEQTIARISRNALDPARKQTYHPVTMLSQGYDSTAVSALASRVGCRKALTFRKSGSAMGYVDDSGTAIASYLNLQTTEYERLDFEKLAGASDAEFYLNPFVMTDKAMMLMKDQLAGGLLMTGRGGDTVWGLENESGLPLLQQRTTSGLMSGTTLTEFRLRVGFIHLPVPFCGARHGPFIRRITLSQEMKPWSVGGDYDRPIPRRIAEEAGVPRDLFGRQKKGGPGTRRISDFQLSPSGEQDFLDFYHAKVSKSAKDQRPKAGRKTPHTILRQIMNWGRPLRQWLGQRPALRRFIYIRIGHRPRAMWGSKYLYTFHWGFERIKRRYQTR